MITTTWIAIDPIDTLFFRGAESMEAGENHEVDTMFPPMPTTIAGAIRTAIMSQQEITPASFLADPAKWQDKYPFLGTPDEAGFTLTGPLFLVADNILLLPVPAHWYAANLPVGTIEERGAYEVQAAAVMSTPPLGLCGSVADPFWLNNPAGEDMQPLSGYWATLDAFSAMRNGKGSLVFHHKPGEIKNGEAAVLAGNALFDREERVGIALTPERTVKEGHLYSAVHIRLRSGVQLVVGINSAHQVPIVAEGILQLGGEQRVCRYRMQPEIKLPKQQTGGMLLALSPLEIAKLPPEIASSPRASGKLMRIGGWDMARNFHKPMSAWLPAGTVISVKDMAADLPQCISI